MKQTKIAIIGAGNVGSTTAYALMLNNIAAQIILVDIDTVRCQGEIADLSDALPFGQTSSIKSGSAHDASEADIIIIAAGAPQKIGQARTDLLAINKKIIASIVQSINPVQPNAIVIMVTNPVDILTRYTQQHINLPSNQIFGTGTLLDSQRLRCLIAHHYAVSPQSVTAYMLGEHGNSQFAIWSTAHINGTPITELPNTTQQLLATIENQVIQKAGAIIACKGATYFGIAACVAQICNAIIFDKKIIMPLSCYIKQFDTCLSMPVVLGECGIEKIIDPSLNTAEQQKLKTSVQQLKMLQ